MVVDGGIGRRQSLQRLIAVEVDVVVSENVGLLLVDEVLRPDEEVLGVPDGLAKFEGDLFRSPLLGQDHSLSVVRLTHVTCCRTHC